MSTATAPLTPPTAPSSADDLIAMPDDDVRREIIRGELRETPMTRRNKNHSRIEATIVKLLGYWLDQQPLPRGRVHCGEAGFRIRRDPETFVGIDVAYVSPELIAADDPSRPYYDGPPVLAVEVLSPSDTHGAVVEKVRAYLDAGVVAWEVDPDFRTIRIHRPGQAPVMLNVEHELAADPYLPGFRVSVASVFE
ncbi:Uma2 family endonuclease [Tautonia sp. JC769]|uniref:Uma2 family endonuclease n=1 Tax=Tautonia sp. JC769 TaxID=3232135 RepID=UPI003459BF0D